jgi:hypothetical protein
MNSNLDVNSSHVLMEEGEEEEALYAARAGSEREKKDCNVVGRHWFSIFESVNIRYGAIRERERETVGRKGHFLFFLFLALYVAM